MHAIYRLRIIIEFDLHGNGDGWHEIRRLALSEIRYLPGQRYRCLYRFSAGPRCRIEVKAGQLVGRRVRIGTCYQQEMMERTWGEYRVLHWSPCQLFFTRSVVALLHLQAKLQIHGPCSFPHFLPVTSTYGTNVLRWIILHACHGRYSVHTYFRYLVGMQCM